MKKIDGLLEQMRLLRNPVTGCEWDKAQTHESLVKYLKEETQEVIEAINKKDKENLSEELGDLLLQIIFHCQIAEEKGFFDFEKVVEKLSEKIERRHPFVFKSIRSHSIEEQKEMWRKIKSQEKDNA